MNEPPVGYGPIAVAAGWHMLTVFTYIFMNASDFGTMQEAALAAWATKDLPARLLAGQVAKLLNCTAEDVAILVGAGKLRPLGRPKPNAVKYFSSVELIGLMADRAWLDEATKTIGQHWRRKNARRTGLAVDEVPEDILPPEKKPSTKPSTVSSITEQLAEAWRVKNGSGPIVVKVA